MYEWWESRGYFRPEVHAGGTPYTLCMPPPNVTGRLHMGHAMFVTLQDIMARYQRMRGRAVLYLPGTDHAGIATQMVVERALAAEGTSRAALGRAAFEERVWAWKREYGGAITAQLRRLGASCDWGRTAFTLDEACSRAVVEAFVRLHEAGLIYRGAYMVNWAPALGTAVSDLEVEYREEAGSLFVFRYPIAGGAAGEHVPVATTRPETILGDTAVAVHPEDARYAALIGREAEVPMSGGRCVPIVADRHVDREFGTGALKITPAHDVNDYAIGARLGLDSITVIGKDGAMTDAAGRYAGLDRAECRKRIWADMEADGLAIRAEPYTTRVPRAQRGGEVIEPMVSEQWFVRAAPLAAPALDAVRSGRIAVVPARFGRLYEQWLTDIEDWCISRQLWWGHRIPVWYCFASEAAADAAGGRGAAHVVARDAAEARQKAEAEHGTSVVLRQEEDVLDTWFSSGLWPFATLGWPDAAAPDLQRFYPTQMLETGHDILFFWVARMVMMGIFLTGKAPFSTVFLHGLIRDEQGRKMSKSLGNVVDPLDVVREYGTDALRYTLSTGTSPGQDLNLSLDRVAASRKLTNKIWNAAKFVLASVHEVPADVLARTVQRRFVDRDDVARLPLAERWIVSRLHGTIDVVSRAHERLDFGDIGRALHQFFWFDFADWYIEAAKPRLYGADERSRGTCQAVLLYVLAQSLRLWHPVLPYVTETIWQALPHAEAEPALMLAAWPDAGAARCAEAEASFGLLQAVVSAVRNARAEYGVELGRAVPASIVATDACTADTLRAELPTICALAKLDTAATEVVTPPEHGADAAAGSTGSGAVELVVRDGVLVVLPLRGLFDPEKEVQRLRKQRGKLEKELAALQARLQNPKFVDNAPPGVVQQARNQASDLEEQVALVCGKLDAALTLLS